ncbi:MAG TPA: flagellin [Clostridia bacterium]|nr:flagellin [Clostridia bacterium]
MRINHNIASLNTYRQLSANSANGSKSLEKLSSGLRINKAGDDAAGLAISEKMRGQIRGLDQASRNAQDGISLIQTAEGALNETHSILQRMRELAVSSTVDTATTDDRAKIQEEVDQLAKEITRIANTTQFNTQSLLNGAKDVTGEGELTFGIGANAGQILTFSIGAMDAQSLGVARSATTANVLSGATDVTSATLANDVGTAIVNGATLTLSANATAATGTTGAVGGLTITTGGNTSELNGIKIAFADGGDGVTAGNESTTWDAATKTITVTGDFNNGDTGGTYAAAADVKNAINSRLSSLGYTATVNVAGVAGTGTAGTNGTVAGGLAADEVRLTIGAEDQVVKNNATSVTFTSTANEGLTLKLDGSLSAATAATISITRTDSSAATFAGGAKTSDAVAAAGIDVSSRTSADTAITTLDTAIKSVSQERSKLGALQNRLEHTINNLGTSSENLTASESRIRDVDMAKEMMEFTKNNILSQAAQAMLAQANQQPQGVLQLLR